MVRISIPEIATCELGMVENYIFLVSVFNFFDRFRVTASLH